MAVWSLQSRGDETKARRSVNKIGGEKNGSRVVRFQVNTMFLDHFDGQSKLLVRSLLSGASGAGRAADVFHKQQRANPGKGLSGFMETLCRDQVSTAEGQQLTVKPLVCLFPPSFKQNLLSFIHLIHPFLPEMTVCHLLDCLSRDPGSGPWVGALITLLKRSDCEVPHEQTLYTSQSSHRLEELSRRVVGFDGSVSGGWAKCFDFQTSECESQRAPCLSEAGTQRKRKSSVVSPDSDEEMAQQSKRIKMDVCGGECVQTEEQSENVEMLEPLEDDTASKMPEEKEQPAQENECNALPENVKVFIPQIKELLENDTEWDQNSMELFKVLNDCDPTQVEVLCSVLSLPDLPEKTLLKVCSAILALSLDLSYSTAATLIKSLLIPKVESLSEPASRCLVTTMTSFCSRYTRAMCHALIGTLLAETNIGNPQAELLNRLIEGCLDSHYRLLVLQMTLKISWSEATLSIIHCLLDSKPDLNEELFTQLTEHLVGQGPQFTKSVKFAKMMLTVLTKYSSLVTPGHKHSLSSCLMSNETFLKKSLQAALKRISNT